MGQNMVWKEANNQQPFTDVERANFKGGSKEDFYFFFKHGRTVVLENGVQESEGEVQDLMSCCIKLEGLETLLGISILLFWR